MHWFDVALLVVGVIVFVFGFVVMFGAPYLPTLSSQVKAALDLVELEKGQTLLELGSGDGRVMVAAAERGLRVVGYELNPLLALYSWLITRKYRGQVRVVWGNFWRKNLPDADSIFTFLLPKYMTRLDNKIVQQCRKPVKLVSFAFKVPNRQPAKESNGVFLYIYR